MRKETVLGQRTLSHDSPLERSVEIGYTNEKPAVILSSLTEPKAIIQKDSVTYTASGQVEQIYILSQSGDSDFVLDFWYDYVYDGDGNISERKRVSADTETISSITKYFWENGNIEKNEPLWKRRRHTNRSIFRYDGAKNYQYGLPNFLTEPSSWSRNNIIESGSLDYTGSIYWACNPCRTSYTYNLDNYPVEIRSHKQVLELQYKE